MLMPNEIPGLGRRMVAMVLDLLMMMLANQALMLGLREATSSLVLLLVLDYAILLCYSTLFVSGRGQTPGKIMTSLRIIGADGGGVSQVQALVRSVVKWTPLLGVLILQAYLSPMDLQLAHEGAPAEPLPEGAMAATVVFLAGSLLWLVLLILARNHPDGQGLHDRVARTLVMQLQ